MSKIKITQIIYNKKYKKRNFLKLDHLWVLQVKTQAYSFQVKKNRCFVKIYLNMELKKVMTKNKIKNSIRISLINPMI